MAIALVVPEDTDRFFGDPFFAEVVAGHHAMGSRTASTCSTSSSRTGSARREDDRATCSAATSTARSSCRTTPATTSSPHSMRRSRSSSAVGRSGPRSTTTTTSTSTTPRRRRDGHAVPDRPRPEAHRDDRRSARHAGRDRPRRRLGARPPRRRPRTDLLEHGDFTPSSGAAAMRALLERGARPRRRCSSRATSWRAAPSTCCASEAAGARGCRGGRIRRQRCGDQPARSNSRPCTSRPARWAPRWRGCCSNCSGGDEPTSSASGCMPTRMVVRDSA